jgi:hypothetical protein
VGTGTGVWAAAAARLGARRVVAIEREPLLRPIIEKVLAENGVSRRVEVITGDFRRVSLSREFDVVVSETVGSVAFDEDIVPVMSKARRLLRRGGALIPERITFLAAPVRWLGPPPRPSSLGAALSSFDDLVGQFPQSVRTGEIESLAPATAIAHIDLYRCRPKDAALGEVSGQWRVRRARRIDGIALWMKLGLAPRVSVETRNCPSWVKTLFPVDRLSQDEGVLTFSLSLAGQRTRWRVALEGRRGREGGDYCPEFAYGSVRAARARQRLY